MTERVLTYADDVVVEQREQCFKGFYQLDRVHLKHRLFAGSMGPTIIRELFVRPMRCVYCPMTRIRFGGAS